MIDHIPHGSGLRKGRFSGYGIGYFITKCILNREDKILNQPDVAQILLNSFLWGIKNAHIKMGAFVIMPNHYHLIIVLIGTKSLSEIINSIDHFSARQINLLFKQTGKFWEEGFYDHAIRN